MKSKKRQRRDLVVRVIEDAIFLYIMGAGLYTILYLLNEIFEKMGVA